jgi:hypothetical protein
MSEVDYYEEVLMLRKKVKAYEDTNSSASDNLVVKSLKKYYDICSKPDKVDCSDDIIEPDQELLQAIDRVLADYMPQDDYDRWKNENNL